MGKESLQAGNWGNAFELIIRLKNVTNKAVLIIIPVSAINVLKTAGANPGLK
jgi:hypothetical protein